MEITKLANSLQTKFAEIETKEDAGELLVILQDYQKKLKKIDSQVREKMIDLLEESEEKKAELEFVDENTGEYRKYLVSNRPATVTEEYNPESILNAFGPIGAKFMKVKKTAVDNFIKEGLKARQIDQSKIDIAKENSIKKTRSGGIVVKEIK